MRFCFRGRAKGVTARLVALLVILGPASAFAWKPHTHIYAANQATGLILSDLDVVNIQGKNYPVIPEVAAAIRAYPDYYQTGVVGPDAFPDIFVGQGFIHPDTRHDNGRDGNDAGYGHSFSYEWMRHIYQAGWAYYNSHPGEEGKKILAFTYGFLTHAAGDMWAHTFVNDWAGGVFPGISEVLDYPIAARHIVVEAYVGQATPTTPINLVRNSQVLSEFIYWSMMEDGAKGGFIDSAGFDAQALGRGEIYDFFFRVRNDLADAIAWMEDLDNAWIWLDPLAGPSYLFMLTWMWDIEDGMHAWADMSQNISADLFQDRSFGAAKGRVGDFILDHLLDMLGVPDPLVFLVNLIADTLGLFDLLLEPLKDDAIKLVFYMVNQATGVDLDEVISYVTHPEQHINKPELGFAPTTSAQIDALMLRADTEPFDKDRFAPMYNTIMMSKLILLSPESLNQLLYDNRVGAIYTMGGSTDNENATLGFIRTLDGHQQWRKNTAIGYSNSPFGAQLGEGMPIWSDCLARERVFRVLFKDWQNGSATFPDLGEPSLHLSATPPPGSSIAINGPTVIVGGVQFVGNSTTFTSSGTATHFWNTNEIQAEGQYLPGGALSSAVTSTTFGPIVGPDGVYNLNYRGIGLCPDGGQDYPGTLNTKVVTLDQTPPTITVPVPSESQILDVNVQITFDMNATDAGSGVETLTGTLDGNPISDLSTIDSFLLDAGLHTIVVNSTDMIGNASSLTRLFEVHATIQGLKSAVSRAYSEGLITKPTTQTALQQMLDSAQKAFNKGQKSNAANKVAAARDLVSGQLGNGVETVFGTRFIGWCNDLISRLV